VSWKINIHPEVADWLRALETGEPESAALIRQAIIQLANEGPTAKRPLVDRVKGSRYHNMKELRPGSAGRSIGGPDSVRLRPRTRGHSLGRRRQGRAVAGLVSKGDPRRG
jgi:hypothetical protein